MVQYDGADVYHIASNLSIALRSLAWFAGSVSTCWRRPPSNINTVSRSSRFLVPSLCGLHRGASVILLKLSLPYQKRRAANVLRRNSSTIQGEVPWSWFWHILRYLITAAAPAHEMDHSVLTVLYVGCSFAVRVSWDRASHDICSWRHVC